MSYVNFATFWAAKVLSPKYSVVVPSTPKSVCVQDMYPTRYCKVHIKNNTAFADRIPIAMVFKVKDDIKIVRANKVGLLKSLDTFLNVFTSYFLYENIIIYPVSYLPVNLRVPDFHWLCDEPKPLWFHPFLKKYKYFARRAIRNVENNFKETFLLCNAIKNNAMLLAELLEEKFPEELFTMEYALSEHKKEYGIYSVYKISNPEMFL